MITTEYRASMVDIEDTYRSSHYNTCAEGISNLDINIGSDIVDVNISMRLARAPSDIDDVYKMMADIYLKDKGINMTINEIVEKFLPEYIL